MTAHRALRGALQLPSAGSLPVVGAKAGATVRLHHGDCFEVMRGMADASVDAIVTDPPYALTGASRGGSARVNDPTKPYGRHNLQPKGFMGMAWDGALPTVEIWSEALRVAKPGAHLLAFGGTRTFHRLTCAIEDAGWEIKDCLSWLYGSGFPKHKTLLKPAWEPVVMAAKPGPRVVNVDACRIGTSKRVPSSNSTAPAKIYGAASVRREDRSGLDASIGRWPANVMLDEEAAQVLDQQSGIRRDGWAGGSDKPGRFLSGVERSVPSDGYGGEGGASRFFYVAKAATSERNAGLNGERCTHPTVKPAALMCWLVRLVSPQGGLVLDPFMGSGTTGIACVREGRSFVGIEREAEYVEIARARITGEAPLLVDLTVSAA